MIRDISVSCLKKCQLILSTYVLTTSKQLTPLVVTQNIQIQQGERVANRSQLLHSYIL